MQKHEDNLAARINGNGLSPLSGASVTVTDTATGLPAALYSDNGVTVLPQPLVTDDTGHYAFYAADGRYLLTFSGVRFATFTREVILEDPKDNPYATLGALAAPTGSTLIGHGSRTLAAKLGEFVSVKDTPFNAVGDGVADDTAALAAAFSSGYGVYLPYGRYKVKAPSAIAAPVAIKCDKRGAMIFADTDFVAGNVTRTYVDSLGATQTLTWNDKSIFYLVCPTNSYLTDFSVDGLSFDLPSDGSIGVFNAQRVAHSSFRNLFCDASAYFGKGYDLWMIEWSNIRSRFSKDHFNINTGTSNKFSNVHCDGKAASGGNGFTFTGLDYTVLNACGTDSVDRCYYVNGGDITLNGCGAESFSRMIQVVGGANVTVNGGSLAVYKAASATGTFTPYQFDGAGTKVTFSGTWLGVKNPADAGGTYDKLAISNGAQVSMTNVRYPVELNATKWWFVANGNSALSLFDAAGTMHYNQYGQSRRDALSNIKTFDYTKAIAAGSAQSLIRIDNAAYGDICFGKISLALLNGYGSDLGFAGPQEYRFTCVKETTASQVLTKLGDALTTTNTGGTALGTLTATLVRNGDNTVDLQLNVPATFGSTTVTVSAEYQNYSGGSVKAECITGV